MMGSAEFPPAVQFGLKQRSDPEWYDLSWLNSQRGVGVGITQDEVDEALVRWCETRDVTF